MIVDRLDAVLFCFIDDLACCVLRQKMRLNDVATLTVSDQSALAGNDRPVQLKLALESNAILFADCFIRTKKCDVQVNRSQSKRELCCKLIVVSLSAHREELKLCFSPKISSTLMKFIVRQPRIAWSSLTLQATPLVYLRARTNSGVKVPVGQSTACP